MRIRSVGDFSWPARFRATAPRISLRQAIPSPRPASVSCRDGDHLVRFGTTLLQIPLTYGEEPLDRADDALIVEMQHSILGTRWVYDGLRDPRFNAMFAAVANDWSGRGTQHGHA